MIEGHLKRHRLGLARAAALALACGLAATAPVGTAWAAAAGPASLMLEDLTSTELKERLAAGITTVLVPIGGTEQNGPHLALGKHNLRAKVLALRIAERLGTAVVAPVVAYVPEGNIDPASQHMRWAGTISISEAAFEATLEGAARSFRQHGFSDVVFLPDHGGYVKNVERVAAKLNRELGGKGGAFRALALGAYYQVTQTDYLQALKSRGFSDDEIGRHAGLADTSLALAIDPSQVRMDAAAKRARSAQDGVSGDPRRASAELGRLGTDRIVEVSVAAIQARQRERAGVPAAGATMPAARQSNSTANSAKQ